MRRRVGKHLYSTVTGKWKGSEASEKMKEIYENPSTAVILDDLADSPYRDTVLSEDQSGFFDAVRDGNEREVRAYVLEKHVDVNCVNLIGETALQIAVNNDHHDIAKFLTEQGADVSSALLQAVAKESIDSVKALLDLVQDPTETQRPGPSTSTSTHRKSESYSSYISPLMLAAQNENKEMVRLFLKRATQSKTHRSTIDLVNAANAKVWESD